MRVATPVKAFTGEVVGVSFVDGFAEVDDPAALTYFTRHGYRIEAPAPEAPAPEAKPRRTSK